MYTPQIWRRLIKSIVSERLRYLAREIAARCQRDVLDVVGLAVDFVVYFGGGAILLLGLFVQLVVTYNHIAF